MENTIKNIKKNHTLVEGVFSNLFGNKNNQVTNNPKFDAQGIKKTGISSYNFNGNTIDKLTLDSKTTLSDLFNFDFKNSKLSFLLTSKYNAISLQLDLKKEKVTYFEGDWYEGPFYGGKFIPVSEFRGDLFSGDFIGVNEEYKSGPLAFKDGTFYDTSKTGILGLSDVTDLENEKTFNLITIPEGYYIKIKTNNDVSSHIHVIKRLNKENSLFLYEIYNGEKDETTRVQLHWEEIKYNYNKFSKIPTSGIKEIPYLFNTENTIDNISISNTPVKYTMSKDIDVQYSGKPEKFDIQLLPIGLKGILTLNFTIPSEYENYLSLLNYIKNNKLNSDLNVLKKAIGNGFLNKQNITHNYAQKQLVPDIFDIFIYDGKNYEITPEQNRAIINLNSFYYYVIQNIVKAKTLEKSTNLQDLVRKKIKDYLLSDVKIEKSKASTKKDTTSSPATTSKPGSNIKNIKF